MYLTAVVLSAIILRSESPAGSPSTLEHSARQISPSTQPELTGESLNFDADWRFHLGDISPESFRPNGDEAKGGGKGGSAWGAAAPSFDDRAWKTVDLPHDWVVEQPFDQNEVRSQGYRPRGIAWYRKSFTLAPTDSKKDLELRFDGIATHATVWLNGTLISRNWNGYTSFKSNISQLARFGSQPNVIAVRVDASAMEGWWYEGGGIYRHTWLCKRPKVHIATDGVCHIPQRVTPTSWRLPISAQIENSGETTTKCSVQFKLINPAGKTITTSTQQLLIGPVQTQNVKLNLEVLKPVLWSLESPQLYRIEATVTSTEGHDSSVTTCGFRTTRFDAKRGFFLNDKPVKIKGVCCHQDHAGVGVAVPDSLWEFRLRRLKKMGANAYRTSHNPPSKEFLDACDRMGVLVMDENRHFNTSEECLEQLRWMVRRDRNHPSVVLWSLFNEENELQGNLQGRRMVRRMMAEVKQLDPSRPITAAQNGGQLSGQAINPENAANELDVIGINYQVDKYDLIRAAYPTKPIISSEDTSQVMTRGAFSTDWQRLVLSSYDDKYPGWASDNRGAWEAIAKQPTFAGGFIWTGFDYRGEPSPFGWPAVSSYFGCMDTCGFPKTAYYIRQALWLDKPILQLVPHWNWSGKEGQPIRVMAVTNADSVALKLNGVTIGTKKADPFRMVEWQVPFQSGQLEAIGYKQGREVARSAVETTGKAVALRLEPDRANFREDSQDAIPVTVVAVDASGRVVPTANFMVTFQVSASGAIIGLGNGDPTSHEAEHGYSRSLFNGYAQVILQRNKNSKLPVELTASAEGMSPGGCTVRSSKDQ